MASQTWTPSRALSQVSKLREKISAAGLGMPLPKSAVGAVERHVRARNERGSGGTRGGGGGRERRGGDEEEEEEGTHRP